MVTKLQAIIDAKDPTNAASVTAAMNAQSDLMDLFDTYACTEPASTDPKNIGEEMVKNTDCQQRLYAGATDGEEGTDAMETTTDPSFFQVAVSYAFGDTSVGVLELVLFTISALELFASSESTTTRARFT